MRERLPSWVRAIARTVLYIPRELLAVLDALIRNWPGSLGFTLRRWYFRLRLKHLGRGAVISPGVRFYGHRYISVGDHTHVDLDCIILAGPVRLERHEVRRLANPYFTLSEGEVSIGKGVHIAPRCLIVGHGGVQIGDYCGVTSGTRIFSVTNHYASFEDPTRRDVLFTVRSDTRRAYIVGPVVMQRNTGVAVNSVVLPGTTLCEESFVGIGSVARGVIPPNSIAAGNPAVRIRDRFPTADTAREKHPQ